MRTKLLAGLAWLVSLGLGPHAQACDEDTISGISNGGTIVMESGDAYRAANESDVSSWSDGDNVLVCKGGTLIVNTDENETADVRPAQ